jgi:hypothetical protein
MALGFPRNDASVVGGLFAIPAFLVVSLVGSILGTISFGHLGTAESRVKDDVESYWKP